MLTMTLAAAAEPTRGWGGPIALALVAALYVAGATLHHHYRGPHSPTEGDDPGIRINAQVRSVSDTGDTDRDTGWWGKVFTLPDGRRVRRASPVDEMVDDELDLALDGEQPETMDAAAAQMVADDRPYMEIVRHLMDEYGVSESTAKRAIRTVRALRL